jgi:hypothetical protein
LQNRFLKPDAPEVQQVYSKFRNRPTKVAKAALNTARQHIRRDKFADWLREDPGGSFKAFYVESVVDALEGKRKHRRSARSQHHLIAAAAMRLKSWSRKAFFLMTQS